MNRRDSLGKLVDAHDKANNAPRTLPDRTASWLVGCTTCWKIWPRHEDRAWREQMVRSHAYTCGGELFELERSS